MRRREFITLLGGAAARGRSRRARSSRRCRWSGFSAARARGVAHLVAAFRQGLKEAGFVEGQNVAIEYRYADNQFDRLPALVADLIRRPVAVIVGDIILRRSRPRPQPRRCRSSSRPGATRSGTASSPASTGRAAMSRA